MTGDFPLYHTPRGTYNILVFRYDIGYELYILNRSLLITTGNQTDALAQTKRRDRQMHYLRINSTVQISLLRDYFLCQRMDGSCVGEVCCFL
jgi:hypothetical protein